MIFVDLKYTDCIIYRVVRLSPERKRFLGHDTKLYQMLRLKFGRSGDCGLTCILSLLTDSLRPEVVVRFPDPSMDQIDLLKNYFYTPGILDAI